MVTYKTEAMCLIDEALKVYIDRMAQEMWDLMCQCRDSEHSYFWPIHNITSWIQDSLDYGLEQFVNDVFDGDPSEFLPYFEQSVAGLKLLLMAGKGNAAPKVAKKPILEFLRRSNRPRHLTEIGGYLEREHEMHINNARLSAYLSHMQKEGLVRNRMCPVYGTPIERGYWWVDGVQEVQLELNFGDRVLVKSRPSK